VLQLYVNTSIYTGELSDSSHPHPVKSGKDEITFYERLHIKQLHPEQRGVVLLFETWVSLKEAEDAHLC